MTQMKLIQAVLILIFIKSTLLTNIDSVGNQGLRISYQQDRPEDSLDLSRIIRSPEPLYLDVVVVLTQNSIYQFRNYQIDIEKYLSDVFATVGRIFAWHNIIFSVAKIEYWEGSNNPNIGHESLEAFVKYFTKIKSKYDSHVVFGEILSGFFGLGYVNTICTTEAVALIETSAYIEDANLAAHVVAHEIGHNLGFEHADNLPECKCAARDSQYCLMNSFNEDWTGKAPKSIEDCRMNQLLAQIDKYPCLKKPIDTKRLFSTCGDGVIDEGEDCDCAFGELCHLIAGVNQCCNIDTCKFLDKTFQCSRGECCDGCQFVEKKICRASLGNCDMPEYCNGTYNECPENSIQKNYEICNQNKDFCYDGECLNLDKLCKHAFNDDEAYFSEECVEEVERIISTCNNPGGVLYKLLCNNPDVCKHFICGRPRSILKDTTGFVLGQTVCIIPLENARKGLLQFGANYMECSGTGKKFCFNGKCVNDTKSPFNLYRPRVNFVNNKKVPKVKYTKSSLLSIGNKTKIVSDYISNDAQNQSIKNSYMLFAICGGIAASIALVIAFGLLISKKV